MNNENTTEKENNNYIYTSQDNAQCYNNFFKNLPTAMLLIDPESTKIMDVNGAACSFYKYSYEDLLKLKLSEITISLEKENPFQSKLASTQGSQPLHLRHVLSNGEIRDVEVEIWPSNMADKELLCATVRDITECMKAKDEMLKTCMEHRKVIKILEDNEERWSSALECSEHGVWDCNPATNKAYFSKEWKEILGYKENEISGSLDEWEKRLHPEDKAAIYFDLDSHIDGSTPIYKSTYRLRKKDGSYIWVLSKGKVISRDKNGQPLRAIGTISDVTAQKLMEEDLKKAKDLAEKACITKNEFIANMSHELRTPLNIILGAIQLFDFYLRKDSELEREKMETHLKYMKQNSLRLLRLVNNLIDSTKIDSGFYEPFLGKHNIISLVKNIAFSVSDYAKQKNITLSFYANVEEFFLICDGDMMERILLNLISNAIKFTNNSIEISIFKKTNSIFIIVKDNGIGIEKENQKMIFERYRQVSKLLVREHEGSGIGLSLTKALIELQGGNIDLVSEYGKGSEFIIEFPLSTNTMEEFTLNTAKFIGDTDRLIEKMNIEFSDIYL